MYKPMLNFITNSLVNGFRKTGIYPINRNEILDRLPTKDNLPNKTKDSNDGEELKQRVSDAVLEFLHTKRYGDGNDRRQRREKVQVQSGKSVSADDVVDDDNEAPVKRKKKEVLDNQPGQPTPSTSTGTFSSPPIKPPVKKKKKVVQGGSDSSSDDPMSDYSVYSEFEEEDFDEDFYLGLEESPKPVTNRAKKIDKKTKTTSPGVYEKGQYVLVTYEGEFFPGVITEVGSGNLGEDYKVSTMTMSGPTHWKWPEKLDECWYRTKDIKDKISAPTPINARGTFAITEVEKWRKMDKDFK